MANTTIPNGVGVSLDEKRRNIPTRQRNWLGKPPRNSGRQYPIVPGMESKICTGDLVSTNESGKLTVLSEGTTFAGVCAGVGLNPQGNPVASIRIGRLWEMVEGLGPNTERGSVVYADPTTQTLTLSGGVPVGTLTAIEEFGGGLRGHVELEAGIPGKPINADLKEATR